MKKIKYWKVRVLNKFEIKLIVIMNSVKNEVGRKKDVRSGTRTVLK
jgi:hypothetical protein